MVSVGGFIVRRARERRVQGEGSQERNASLVPITSIETGSISGRSGERRLRAGKGMTTLRVIPREECSSLESPLPGNWYGGFGGGCEDRPGDSNAPCTYPTVSSHCSGRPMAPLSSRIRTERTGARSCNISISYRTHAGLCDQDRTDSTPVGGDDITPGSPWSSISQRVTAQGLGACGRLIRVWPRLRTIRQWVAEIRAVPRRHPKCWCVPKC